MNYDVNGLIIPGKSVGDIKIGWTYEELVSNISGYTIDRSNPHLPDNVLHEINGNIVIFLSENNIIQEICVQNEYVGKVNGIFGIGDKLCDFASTIKYETNFADGEGFFYFPQNPGLRVLTFDWNEEGTSQITFISVYDVVLGTIY